MESRSVWGYPPSKLVMWSWLPSVDVTPKSVLEYWARIS
jgi:hypothetical protein